VVSVFMIDGKILSIHLLMRVVCSGSVVSGLRAVDA